MTNTFDTTNAFNMTHTAVTTETMVGMRTVLVHGTRHGRHDGHVQTNIRIS